MDPPFARLHVHRALLVRAPRAHTVWLDQRDEGRPFLLFLNYMDAHSPSNTKTPRPEVAVLEETDSNPLLEELHLAVMPGTDDGPAGRLELLRDQYDVVLPVTSDHGEFLGEHRLIAHSKDFYEPVMGVPMWLKRAGQSAGDVEECAPLAAREWASPWPSALVLGENHFSRLKDLREPWAHRPLRSRWVAWKREKLESLGYF